jgi:hypothetical protein
MCVLYLLAQYISSLRNFLHFHLRFLTAVDRLPVLKAARVTQQETPCTQRNRAGGEIATRSAFNERMIVALPGNQPWQRDDSTINRVLYYQV